MSVPALFAAPGSQLPGGPQQPSTLSWGCLRLAVVLTSIGALWLAVLHQLVALERSALLPLLVRDIGFALPAVLAGVNGAAAYSERLLRRVPEADERLRRAVRTVLTAAAAAAALAITRPAADGMAGLPTAAGPALELGLVRDTLLAFGLLLPVAAVLIRASAARARGARTPLPRRARPGRAGLAMAVVSAVVGATGTVAFAAPASAAGTTASATPNGVCAAATRTITYDVKAMQLDLPLNGWGDHVPDGLMYALNNSDAFPNAADIAAEPRRATPLVLRAAVGDCIKVTFTNAIADKRVGMHVDGVAKDVKDSDGARVGNNPDTTVPTNGRITYTWFAQREGQFPINDYGSGTNFTSAEPSTDTTSHGLYGGLVVLPAGSVWTDPVTRRDLLDRSDPANVHGVGAPVFADVHVPGAGNDFRDYALVFMDEPEGICGPGPGRTPGDVGGDPGGDPGGGTGSGVADAACAAPTFPTTGLPDSSFGFNYRTEPLRNRLRAVLQHNGTASRENPTGAKQTVTLPNGTVILPQDHFCDGWTNDQDTATNEARLAKDQGLSGCLGEESHLQSWAFGDEGKLTRATDETDVLTLPAATGGTFTLTVEDPTLTGSLTADGSAVDRSAARFRGERTTTAPIPFDATAAQVQAALLRLKVLPMADLAPGDVTVSGGSGRLEIAFAQHFAGRDLAVSVDGRALVSSTDATVAASASDAKGDGGRKGSIEVLSDAVIPHAYRGDPLHMRLIHPGVKETHPFHQHTNRWRQEPADPMSTRLDVQSIGPGQTFDLVYEGGAGEAITADPSNLAGGARSMDEWVRAGRPDLAALAISKASNGDHIFHCHLYPHFAQGFWGALRVFDRQRPQDPALWPKGTPRTYADATPIQPLAVLPDFDLTGTNPTTGATVRLTELPDAAHPGYPLMLKGEYLQRAYRAPGAVVADRYGDPALNWRRPGDTVRDFGSAATTDLERANMVTSTDSQGTKHAIPGAFFINPCPTGAPVREYHPTAIDAKIVYNKAGWNDPGGKLYVEAPPSDPADPSTSIDVANRIRGRINAGQWQAEPYNIRARLGECVNMRTTNATNLDNNTSLPLDVHDGQISATGVVTGGTAFHAPTLMSELSTHVHLVRFDELATDGTSVGWNYVQAPMVGQTWNYRWFADVALRTVYFHDHQNPNTHQQHGLWAAMNVEPNQATFNDPRNGDLLAPSYCAGLGLPTARQADLANAPPCYGVGSVSDIRVPTDAATGVNASFREFTVNYSDYVPLQDAAGKPINPPDHPDEFAADQGGMAINYRNEPFPVRVNDKSTGNRREPAYVFSSAAHGDPSTPIFRAYQHDPVIFRFMGGAHEEGHNFTLGGHRWLHEPDDPNSNLYDSQFVMISEFFNMEVSGNQVIKRGNKNQAVQKARQAADTQSGTTMVLPGGAGAPGDYLYGSQPLNDLWMGMWGIFRVPAKRVPDLQPLPSNAAPSTGTAGTEWSALRPGDPINPAPVKKTANPCPPGSPKKSFDVSLVQQKIVYDAAGDNDPNGVAYVLSKDLDAAGRPKAGTALKPLFIRANEGDCVDVTLTNRLPAGGTAVGSGDPVNPVELVGSQGTTGVSNLVNGMPTTVRPTWPAGARASLHVSGLVKYAVTDGDGAAIGYNYDSTVKPGASITYTYYLDSRGIGAANLADYGNLRGSRHHGAWGSLVVEPKGATYLNPADLTPTASGEQAVIRYPDGKVTRSYREFVADEQDGLNLFDKNGSELVDQVKPDVVGGPVDPEDQGEKGINYRTERFSGRLGDVADVFSSRVFGDPATPVFRAYRNDPVMVRILNSQDLPRVHTFGISGHSWRYELNDANSNVVTGQGGLNTGRAFNAGICAGSNTPLQFKAAVAGAAALTPGCGTDGIAGDYLYNDRNFFSMLSGGAWGLIRVHDSVQPDLKPLP
jgi:hypothetical protein